MEKWVVRNFLFLLFAGIVQSRPNIPFSSGHNPEEDGEYFEGDMVLDNRDTSAGMNTRAGIVGSNYRWPGGVIPYQIESNYPQNLKTMLNQAMSQISQKTCIKFKSRTTESAYISVQQGRGCYSSVGRVGSKQIVSLPGSCRTIGTFIHELIHAIGFFHEQSRTDRDQFVRINWDNVKPGKENNFAKYGSSTINPFGVSYDYGSVMHYSSRAFSKNWGKTIEPIKNGVEIGQRRGLSSGDIQKINNMYCK